VGKGIMNYPLHKHAGWTDILRSSRSGLRNVWHSLPARATRGVAGKGLNLLFGAMMGAAALEGLADLRSNGRVGLDSRIIWERELERHLRRNASPERSAARRSVSRGKLLGVLGGALAGIPLSIRKRNILPLLAGSMMGRSLGGVIASKINPLAQYQPSAIDPVMSQYAGILSQEQLSELVRLRNSPQVRNSPEAQHEIAELIRSKLSRSVEAQRYRKRKTLLRRFGQGVGTGVMLAAMLFAKKRGRGILARPGGFLSGDTLKPLVALGLAGTAINIADQAAASRRLGLGRKETAKRVFDKAYNAETGMELAWALPALKLRKAVK